MTVSLLAELITSVQFYKQFIKKNISRVSLKQSITYGNLSPLKFQLLPTGFLFFFVLTLFQGPFCFNLFSKPACFYGGTKILGFRLQVFSRNFRVHINSQLMTIDLSTGIWIKSKLSGSLFVVEFQYLFRGGNGMHSFLVAASTFINKKPGIVNHSNFI